jgi:hypothetical protein
MGLAMLSPDSNLVLGRVLILTALTVSSVAQAQPVFLGCSGELVDHVHATSEKHAIIIAVNLEARSLTVLGYDSVPIMSEAADGTVGFAATERDVATGVTAGNLNRITGLTWIDFKTTDGILIFDGTCKRPEKLF